MATTLTHELTYDAPLADVAAMLGDPAFREEVSRAQEVLRHDVRIERTDAALSVRVEQVRTAEGMPSFARRIVGDEMTIVQEERWTTPDRGDVTVTIPGKPGDVTGTVLLRQDGATTTEAVDLRIKVSIPLVGGKVEDLIASILRKALVIENAVGRDYLSR